MTLLDEIFLDSLGDGFNVEMLAADVESLENDEVFDILENLLVDASKTLSTREPRSFSFLIVLEIVLPNPGSTVSRQLTFIQSDLTGLLDDLRINFLLLLPASSLDNRLRYVQL